MKQFIKQIFIEIKKLFKQKVMLVFVALLLVFSFAIPIIGNLIDKKNDDMNYYYNDYEVREISYSSKYSSQFYGGDEEGMYSWQIEDLIYQIEELTANAKTQADDLAIAFYNSRLEVYIALNQNIKTWDDYRSNIEWQLLDLKTKQFIFNNLDKPYEDIIFAVERYQYYELEDFKKQFIDVDETEKLKEIDRINEMVSNYEDIILNDNYVLFSENRILEEENNIINFEKQIESLKEQILENPEFEKDFGQQINYYEASIATIKETTLRLWQYRIDNDIKPISSDWRHVALNDIENLTRQSNSFTTSTREEYQNDEYLKGQYKTYEKYTEAMDKQKNEIANKLLVAEYSIENKEPDMKYVTDGSRNKVVAFLWYSLVISFLAVLICGRIIAKEYQSGTIRLLLIRPKSRIKILLSKLSAVILVCFSVYLLSVVLNIISTGIIYGFSDFGFMNYTVSSGVGGISFFLYYLSRFFVCFISILFAGCFAFLLSVATRNTAFAVAIPLVGYVGSFVLMQIVQYSDKFSWIVYTPLMYIDMSSLYRNSYQYSLIKPLPAVGIPMMIGLAVCSIVLACVIFIKRDVKN